MSADVSLRTIEEVGIIPSIRVTSHDDARFAVDAVYAAGITVVEITMTTPQALEVIASVAKARRGVLIGAGTVLDADVAERCIEAGAHFITSPGLAPRVVERTIEHDVLMLPGAVTPTEVMAARSLGVRAIKVFPCAEFGGPALIHALKPWFPDMHFLAAGGVTQLNAEQYINAGATALGVGAELIPRRAVDEQNRAWIAELVHRFRQLVYDARVARERFERR